MSSVSLGDLAKSFMLRRHNVSLKQDLQRLTTELTTGKVSDTAQHVSGDLMQLSGIDGSLARLKGFNAITNEAIDEWIARLSAPGGLRGCLETYRAGLKNARINKELITYLCVASRRNRPCRTRPG